MTPFTSHRNANQTRHKMLLIALTLLIASSATSAQEKWSNIRQELLIEDTRQLVEILENSHPDPYLKGGGKIAFHRRFQEVLLQIPEEGLTLKEYYRLLLPLVGSVGDGHTFLLPPWPTQGDSGLPFTFNIVDKNLYAEKVFEPGHKFLLGAKLKSINNISFGDLLERFKPLIGWDTEYQLLTLFRRFLNDLSLLGILFPEWNQERPLKIEFLLPTGETKSLLVSVKGKIPSQPIEAPSKVILPSTEKIDFAYSFLDPEKETCLLRIDGMFGYRENFELFRAMGANWVPLQASRVYEKFHQKKAPDNLDQLIAAIPSATETFRQMVEEMKKTDTKKLLVDLRKNGGGNFLMAYILAYFLFDQEEIKRASDSFSIKKYSDLYFANYPNDSLEKVNEGRKIALTRTDYGFADDPYFKNKLVSAADKEAEWEKQLKMIPTFYSEYKSGLYKKYYRPDEIVIISSPWTYSSAHTLMLMFYRMGAKIIGVPSGQAGNCFGDILMFQLKNTGIRGYVSHKLFISFPEDPSLGHILKPHRELTYDDLRRCQFDPNASILLALGEL